MSLSDGFHTQRLAKLVGGDGGIANLEVEHEGLSEYRDSRSCSIDSTSNPT